MNDLEALDTAKSIDFSITYTIVFYASLGFLRIIT